MINQEYKNTQNYASYMNCISEAVKNLDLVNSNEITLELESHIYEAMQSKRLADLPEGIRLEIVLAKLGEPKTYIKAIIDEQELQTALQKHQVVRIMKASIKNTTKNTKYFLTSILYLFSLAFIVIAIIKLIYPESTGLFMGANNAISLGHVTPSMVKAEMLGYWIIPIMVILSIMFYFVATLILKNILKNSRTNKWEQLHG